jgi:aspartyl-tRNA(Asn)/glutamyl-tRNA(Gln) amidotransferase subunit B
MQIELETVIGLEIHAQLSTKSKMFCGCDNDAFGAEPNTRVCPVCMGFPGMLPVLNSEALRKGVLAAAALGCKIQTFSKFDRKNYFYPDLPTGFQISQFDQPVSKDGEVEIVLGEKKIKIGITRVHLENDAGKLSHEGADTLVDLNRAGTPLVEIVTEPDLRSPEEAQVLAKEVQKILRFVEVSDADMEKGMMRFDASISLRPHGDKKLYARTEIKNLNSFSSLQKALKYEFKKQKKLWKEGKVPTQESTVGWIDNQEKTVTLREKESANDYRYFPEPDLPPLVFTEEEIEEIEKSIPELPLAKFDRYQKELGLCRNDALKLAESKELTDFFEKTLEYSGDAKKSANLILSVVLANSNWKNSKITPENIAEILSLLEKEKISNSAAKEIVAMAMIKENPVNDLMKEMSLEQKSSSDDLSEWADEILNENPKTVQDFKNGKEKVIQFLMGQVMKKSQGAANPTMVLDILKQKLQS